VSASRRAHLLFLTATRLTTCSPALLRARPGPAAGDTKLEALLHGHSYSAHPIGCGVAVAALRLYQDPSANPNVCTPSVPGRCSRGCSAPCGKLTGLWDEKEVLRLSNHPGVHSAFALGARARGSSVRPAASMYAPRRRTCTP
jgi:dethiobiotin synthetase/adenosylmethionine--8-amino-7-oxononanoate aminotransferase